MTVRRAPRVVELAAGERPSVVLVDSAFATEGTLASIMGGDAGGHRLLLVDPVSDLAAGAPHDPLTDVADGYAALLADDEPATVVGYCSTAVLALLLADRLPRRPRVVLVEPSWMTPDLVKAELVRAQVHLGAPAEALAVPRRLDLDVVVALIGRAAEFRLVADGLDADEVEACVSLISDRHRAWFGFLLLTVAAGVPPPGEDTALVLSASGTSGPAPEWTDPAPCHHVADPPDAMNGSAAVRDLLLRLAAGHQS